MIRLGVVGYGRRIHGVIHHVIRQLEPELRVVGIVDPDEAGARQRLAPCDQADAVFYPTLDALVRRGRPDALAIGTRCNLHAPYAVQAARYDLPCGTQPHISGEQCRDHAIKCKNPVCSSAPTGLRLLLHLHSLDIL